MSAIERNPVQERLTIVQSQLPGVENFVDDVDREYDFPTPDVSVLQFNVLIPQIIRVVTEMYVSRDTASIEDVESAIAHDVELAIADNQEEPLLFDYLWQVIEEIANEVEQETVDKAISYSEPEVLKKHVRAMTIHFSDNLKKGGEVTNKADKNSISLSRVATEINTGNPDFIIGHFLHMYWRMIYR